MVGLSRKRVFPKTKGDSITGQDRAQKHCDFRFSQIEKKSKVTVLQLCVQGESPPVQVKDPYGNLGMVTCRLSSCNPECSKYISGLYSKESAVRQCSHLLQKFMCTSMWLRIYFIGEKSIFAK